MRYIGLACDYDGTIAHEGHVEDETIASLERLRNSGRKLILVTGRERSDLESVFPRIGLFDRIVVENGAVLYCPETQEERLLGDSPPDVLLTELHRRGVSPISAGKSIVATRDPHLDTVNEVIQGLKLPLHVILNKGAVMIVPFGLGKTTGLTAALGELKLSANDVVGVGDAENDEGFLRLCGCAAAVNNALPVIKQLAHYQTQNADGRGVSELIEALLTNDLAGFGRPSNGTK